MAKDFGGDLISQGKNTKATGGGAENIPDVAELAVKSLQKQAMEAQEYAEELWRLAYPQELTKTLHLNFTITGDSVDQIDWLQWINDAFEEGSKHCITTGDIKVFFTEQQRKVVYKEKGKE